MPAHQQQSKISPPSFLFTFSRLLQWALNNPLQAVVMVLAAQVVLASAKRSQQQAKDFRPEVNDISDQFNNIEFDLGSQDITHSFEVNDVSEAYRKRKLQSTESCQSSIEFPDISNTWALTLGGSQSEAGSAVALYPDGSVVMTGYTQSFGAGSLDVLLARFSADGVLTWAKTLGGASNEQGNSIALYPDGKIALVGFTNSFGAGNSDILLAQFAENGTLNWAKTLGTVSEENGNNLALQADGGIILTGHVRSSIFGPSSNDLLLARFAPIGSLSWAKILGGSGEDKGNSLALRPNDNIVLTGDAQSFGGALLAEFTANGTLSWARTISSASSGIGNSLALASDGSIVLAGSVDGFGAGSSAMLAQFSANGILNWAKALSVNIPMYYLRSSGLGLSNDGAMVLTGIAYSYGTGLGPGWRDLLLAKFAVNGNLLWAKALGSADYDEGSSLVIRQDGSILLTGYTEILRSGQREALLAQFSPDGLLPTLSTAVGYKDIGSNMLYLDVSTNLTQQQIFPTISDYKPSLLQNTYSPFSANINTTAITALSLVANPSAWQKPYQAVPAFKFSYTIPSELFWYVSGQTSISVDLQGLNWLSYDPFSRRISGTPLLFSEAQAQVVIKPDAVSIIDGSSLYESIVFKFCIGFSENTFIKSSAKGLTGNSLALKPDGSIVVAGNSNALFVGNDAILAEFSTNGALSWAKKFKRKNDKAYSVAVRSDGSILLTGSTDSFETGNYDVLLAAFLSNGTLSWARTLGGANYEQGNSLALRSNGGFVLTGFTHSSAAGNDVLLAEFTSNGTLSWARTLGGANDEEAKSLALRPNGSIVLTGNTRISGVGNADVLLAEFTPNGTLSWVRTFGGASGDDASSLAIRSDGGIVLTGYTTSFGAGNSDILLAQFSANGALSWARAIGGAFNDVGSSLALTVDGNIVLLGATVSSQEDEGDVLLAQFSPNGALSWAKAIGGASGDSGNSLALSPDGSIAITGVANSFGTASSEELLLAKLNADGITDYENAYIRTINTLQVSNINPVVIASNLFKSASLNISARSWDSVQIDDHSLTFRNMIGYLQSSILPIQEQVFNQPYSLDLNSILDSNAGILRLVELNKGTLPSWLQYDRAANRINGTPSGKVRGYYYINMNLQQFGKQQEVTFIINVTNTAPSYTGNTTLATGTGRFVFPLADEFIDREYDVISSYAISQINGQLPPIIASIDANSGRLFGTALSGDQGAYQFNITASDPFNAIGWKVIAVKVQNAAPVVNIIFTDPSPVTVSNKFSFSFERNAFFDPDGDAISYSAKYPTFLNFDANSRTLFGTPESQHRGLHNFTLIASDRYNGTANITLLLDVNGIPEQELVINDLSTSPVNQTFSYTLPEGLFSDPDNDQLSYQLVNDIKHNWLSFNSSSRTISGTPPSNDHQALPIRFTVSDGRGGLASFSMNLLTPNSAPAVKNGLADQEVMVNQVKNVMISSEAFDDIDGDTLSYRIERADGNIIPDWLSIAGSVLNFAPRPGSQGGHKIRLITYDDHGAEANTTFTVNIPNKKPLQAESLPSAQVVTVGKLFSYSFTSTVFKDPDGDDLTYTAQTPGFLSFNANTRTLSSIPQSTDQGIHQVIFFASDPFAAQVNATLTVDVNGIPSQQFSLDRLMTTAVGMPYVYSLPAGLFTDPDGDIIFYSLLENAKPIWLNFNSSSRILSGTPTFNSHQAMPILMHASDGRGGEVDFTVTLITPNSAPIVNKGLADQIVYIGRGKAITVPPSAFHDADADSLSYRLAAVSDNTLPDWISLAGNVLNLAPRTGAQGNHTFSLVAVDGYEGEVVSNFTVLVLNQPPVKAEALPLPAVVTVGFPFVYSFANTAFNDPDGDSISYNIQAPSFLSFNANTRTVSGMPQEQDRGIHEVILLASDSFGGQVNTTITVNINGIPSRQINLNSLQTTTVGEPYSFALPDGLFTDPDNDAISYQLMDEVQHIKPAWLRFDSSSNILSGIPTDNTQQPLPIRFRVSDGRGGENIFDLSLIIPNSVPKAGTGFAEQTIFVNQVKTLVVSKQVFSDADGDSLSYSLEQADAGTMPDWISLAANVINFAPRAGAQGNYTLELIANDGYGGETSLAFKVQVINRKPVQDELLSDTPIVTVGNTFTYRLSNTIFQDPDGDSLTYSVQSPGFLSFNANTRTLFGIPQHADRGNHEVIFIAKDPYGAEMNASMLININGIPARQLNLTSIMLNPVNSAFSYQLPNGLYVDPDGDEISYELSNDALSSWLTFDPETRTLSGTPTDNSHRPLPIKFTVSDGRGAAILYNVALNIPNSAPKEVYAIPSPSDAKATVLWSFAVDADNFMDPDHDLLSYSALQANGSSLPQWLRFNPLRRSFEGVPTGRDRGILSLKVLVSDGMGGNIESFFNTTVVNSAPVAEGVLLNQQVSSQETSFSFKIPAFYDPDGDAVTYSANMLDGSDLPAAIGFDPMMRRFDVHPDQLGAGNYLINLHATDSWNLSQRVSFNLAIQAVPNLDLSTSSTERAKELAPTLSGFGLLFLIGFMLIERQRRIKSTIRRIEAWSHKTHPKVSSEVVEFSSLSQALKAIGVQLVEGVNLNDIESSMLQFEKRLKQYYARAITHEPITTLLDTHIVEHLMKFVERNVLERGEKQADYDRTLGSVRLLHFFIGLILSEHTGRHYKLLEETKLLYLERIDKLIGRLEINRREHIDILFELESTREALICIADTTTLRLLCQDSISHILSPISLLADAKKLAFNIPAKWYVLLLELSAESNMAKTELVALTRLQTLAAKENDWRFLYGMVPILIDIISSSQDPKIRKQAIMGSVNRFGIQLLGLKQLLEGATGFLHIHRKAWVKQYARISLNQIQRHLTDEERALLVTYLDSVNLSRAKRVSLLRTPLDQKQSMQAQPTAQTVVRIPGQSFLYHTVNPLRQGSSNAAAGQGMTKTA
jgi:uncharacterized delta-60 repeat protein